jgi:ATP-dependent DNA ligase
VVFNGVFAALATTTLPCSAPSTCWRLDSRDLRRLPIEQRKQTLAKLARVPRPGIARNEHYVGRGDIVYQQACKLGCEGIVSKQLGSAYHSGRSRHWLKVKNPAAPAVRREAKEQWR